MAATVLATFVLLLAIAGFVHVGYEPHLVSVEEK
jgi:hypothetical protein